jgi:predicted permease
LLAAVDKMTQSLLPLLGAAAGAMVQVLIIATVGYICAKRPKDPAPLLTPDALKVISRVANDVFLPCLSAAVLGARINVANLKGDWVLLPAGVAATALGYAVADLTAAILRPTPALKPALRVAIAHPNAFALPLLILQYLCERPSVKEEFDNDEAACTAEAAASLCLYLTAWHFVFWSYAYGTLEDAAKTAREERSRAETAKLWCKRLFLQPNMIGMYAGVVIGATPLRRLLFRGDTPLRPIGLALETLGAPVVAVTVMIMAAALANGHARRRRTKREFSSVVENNASPSEDTRDVATAIWFILARLVIVPVIAYPIFSVINLPGGRMTTLIILLELAMPGAQTVLVTLNAVGSGHVAEEIAPWYFLQYATAIITLTAFTVWALHIVYR